MNLQPVVIIIILSTKYFKYTWIIQVKWKHIILPHNTYCKPKARDRWNIVMCNIIIICTRLAWTSNFRYRQDLTRERERENCVVFNWILVELYRRDLVSFTVIGVVEQSKTLLDLKTIAKALRLKTYIKLDNSTM